MLIAVGPRSLHTSAEPAIAFPGIPGARGNVGPPLDDYRERVYVAGRVSERAGPRSSRGSVMLRRSIPQTAMPDLGVSEAEARDIAAYLYQ